MFFLDNGTMLSWDTKGMTIIDKSSLLSGNNNSLGIISALKFDSDSNLYIVDKTKHRILKFILDTSTLMIVAGYLNGTNGSDLNSFNSPSDITFNSPTTQFYVADTLNHRILLWSLNTNQGTLVFGKGYIFFFLKKIFE
jgi:hypothetical protein